jgi:hypothetical protein
VSRIDKLMAGLQEHLGPSEVVLASCFGFYSARLFKTDPTRSGILVATNSQVLFFGKKLLGHWLEALPYDHITSIEVRKSGFARSLRLVTSREWVQLDTGRDQIPQFEGLERVIREHVSLQGRRPQPPQTHPGERLRQLEKLHADGLLTDTEFEAKRAAIIDEL